MINHYAPLGTEPEYDKYYDRGPSNGSGFYRLTGPDGAIDLLHDILGVISQAFHDCR